MSASANVSKSAIFEGSGCLHTKEIIDPDYPLLHAQASSINSIKRETFQYRPTEDHKLDVYYPPSEVGDDKTKASHNDCILVFFYGGGLTRGSRSSPPSHLVHNNLGAFFASRGILTVIPDYRLVPAITFPQGSEDIRDALDWVASNLLSLQKGGRNRIFVLAHSAGGLHVSGFLLLSSLFCDSLVGHSLHGVALIGVPYEFQRAKPAFRDAATKYYGNWKNAQDNQPLSLLRHVKGVHIATLPPMRSLVAESEPRSVSSSSTAFVQDFKNRGGNIMEWQLLGHDHISPILALNTGFGEEWGEELVAWMHQ